MALTLGVALAKGGVGKTTTAVHVAHYAAKQGLKVLLLDMDAQGQATSFLGAQVGAAAGGWGLITGSDREGKKVTAQASVTERVRPNLDLVAVGKTLPALENWLANYTGVGRAEHRIKTRLGELKYDLVVIDTSPTLSLSAAAALYACDTLLAPVIPGPAAQEGLGNLSSFIDLVNDRLGHDLTLLGVLPVMLDRRERVSRDLERNLRGFFGSRVGPAVHRATVITTAPGEGKTVFETAPLSRAAGELKAAAKWTLKRLERS